MTALLLERARPAGAATPVDLLVVDGTVAAVGHAAAAHPAAAGAARRDLDGATVTPGLWDVHVHVDQWAASRRRVSLRTVGSAREAVTLMREAAVTSAPDDVLVGHGYQDGLWPDEPHKDLLEAALPGRVVVLQSHDLHTAWLSPAALQRIGAPEHPTGVLLEDACYRAMAALFEFDTEVLDRWVHEALTEAATRGVTGIFDFEIGDALPSWLRRTERDRPDARVVCTVYRAHLDAAIGRGMASGTVVPDTHGLVEVGPLKLFVDGSLNSRTALCHDHYPDLVGSDRAHGLLETPPDDLVALLTRARDAGLTAAVHAIGDRANTLALDAFEATGCRGRIEHAQLLDPTDVPRFAALGVGASVQPTHLLDDRAVAERHWPGRTERAFAFADLAAAGVRLEFGSDAPVAPLDPWQAMLAAVVRTDDERPPWHPEQRLTPAQALAASCGGRIHLDVGDRADLAVLDRDPLTIDPTGLGDVRAVATLLDGRWTHGAA